MVKKRYGIGVKIAALGIIMIQYTITITTPILGNINMVFSGPEYSIYIKMIETLPTLAMIITCLLMGKLLKHFKKKSILIIGTILACAQVLPAFIGGFWIIMIARFITGLGMGICYSFAGSYIIDLYEGKELDNMMGLRATVGAIGGIVIMQGSGILAANYGYQASFLVTFICIPLLLLFIVKLPEPEIKAFQSDAAISGTGDRKIRKFNKSTLAIITANIFTMVFAYTFMTNISIIICSARAAGGLGMTITTASNVMSIFSLAMAISGFIYGRVWVGIFKDYTTAWGLFLIGAGIMAGYFSQSVTTLLVSAILFGLGFQIYNAAILQALSKTTMAEAVAQVVATFFALNSIGQFLSSLVVPALTRTFFPGNLRGDWLIAFVCLLSGTIALVIVQTNMKKKAFEADSEEVLML